MMPVLYNMRFSCAEYVDYLQSLSACSVHTLNGIVKHDVLFSQFQQHGVIKELVNGDIFTEAL